MIRYAFVAVLSMAAFSQLSCKLNDYCLECGTGDGGHRDGGGSGSADAPPDSIFDASTCVPTGDEICDGKDNDCDGLIDEGTLPEVGDPCANQVGECVGGKKQCTPTFHCSVTTATLCKDANDITSCPTGELCKADDQSTDRLTCDKNPVPELCDGLDNNCNGTIDEGDPSDLVHAGGARCGNGAGTCVQGVYHCGGPCVGMADGCTGGDSMMCMGGVGPVAEICDGLDNDCNGMIDDGLGSLGTCGTSMVGACKIGNKTCVGGTIVCMGEVDPTFETCNNVDDDCNGVIDDPFRDPITGVYNQSPQNCGGCGMICGAGIPNGGNAVWGCSAAGACVITACKAGYHNNDGNAANGCEFGVCFTSGAEVCDGVDNDCDGIIDETPAIGAPPGICATAGECKGVVAACPCQNMADSAGCTTGGTCTTSCAATGGWQCNYPATVTVDVNGVIQPETKCDNLDNDCDGIIDNNQPQMEHVDCAGYVVGNAGSCPGTPVACDDGKAGQCRGTGHYQCDDGTFPGSTMPGGNLNGPALCNITTAGALPQAESCNNKDDDCDGVTDEGSSTGSLTGETWIEIGGGHQMMKFEASRPDALANNVVSVATCTSETIANSPAGATEAGTTATFTTNVAHGLAVGQRVTIGGVTVAGYNGTFLVATTPTATTFTITGMPAGLGASGGGVMQTHCPLNLTSATEAGSTATYTTSAAHGLAAGQAVIIAGMTVGGYNGTWVIQTVAATTFTVHLPTTGLGAATGGTEATNGVATCSTNTVPPWTNATYPQALAACQSVGATLCTDEEWHRSCSANATGGNLPTIYPVAFSGANLLIEAEDYFSKSFATDAGGVTRSFVEDETAGFFGISDLVAQPNTGANISAANAPTQSPRMDYKLTVSGAPANVRVCVHMYSNTGNDNSVFVGFNAALPGVANATAVTTSANNVWQWRSSATFSPANGTEFLSVYMATDGVKVDALFLTTAANCNGAADAHTTGEKWGMQPSAVQNNYTSGNCNDQNYMGAGNGNSLVTGSLGQCFADDSGLKAGSVAQQAFDMSGNVREWTLSHQPGQNPIRGGAYNDTSLGIDCPGNFLLADDKFLLPNVGFRCCR